MTCHPDRSTSLNRRMLSRQVRDAFPPMGVYAVRDARTARAWVGASRNVHASLNRIQFELRLGRHANRHMQEAWRQDPARLSFEVLEMVKERTEPHFDYAAELAALEQWYHQQLGQGCTP